MARRRAFFIGLLVGSASLPSYAQDAGSLLREQQRQQDLQRLERLPQPEESRPRPVPAVGPENGETIVVRDLRFTGKVELLPAAKRASIIAADKGKRLGISGIKAIADEVTIAIQARGRMLGYAVLPPQDITEGVVTIHILEGKLERIEFERKSGVRIREELLSGIASSRVQPDGLEKQDLEDALLRMNDLPGVSARAKLVPGATPQSSRLVIDVEQQPIVSAAAWGDNYGNASTGEAESSAQLTLTDLTGYGDQTRLGGTFSEGQQFGQANVSMPLWASGFTANANYQYLTYRDRDDLGKALGLEGHAHFVGFGLDYSLIRSRDLNVRLSETLNWKALVDDSVVGRLQNKRSISETFAVSGDMRDGLFGGGLTSWSLGWTFGNLDLSRVESALAVDQLGLQTQGGFHRLNASFARLQKLPGDFSLFARLYGQWASKNLDSSEDFALGGPYGVRGYPVGEGRGDMGLLETIELRYDAPIPPAWGQVQLATFLDAGQVRINRFQNGVPTLNECGCNAYGLASTGLSARWTRENVSLSVTWAHTLGDNPGRSVFTDANVDGKTSSQQVWLQGTIRF
ncbi:ShlB/FhaC/HecB family hemolysin secretion/activation protein [Bradyrhizobium sp. STM 3562]|uniref:ShlB/FhaC/HecB family hemolysin secretion/activation protein n=1 Tax=Bradyrhizobium sp. STM 3562 TaxID=578924 RepID=UPI003890EA14